MRTPPETIAYLARAFPRQAITEDTFRVYLAELSDLDPAALEDAARALIRTGDFFPTIGEVRAAVAERTLQLPGEPDALAQVEARVAWGRDGQGDPPAVHALVREALDLVGGWHAYRSADEPSVVRGQFLRLYRGLRAERLRDARVGRELAPAPPRPELTA